jgi:hypothetical protein
MPEPTRSDLIECMTSAMCGIATVFEELAIICKVAANSMAQFNTALLLLLTPAQRRRYWKRFERDAKWDRYIAKVTQ